MMQTKKYARLVLAGSTALLLAGALGGCSAHADMDKLNAAATRTEAAADRAAQAAADAEKAARSAEAAADRAERAFAHNIKK
jgi:hypothetical protein